MAVVGKFIEVLVRSRAQFINFLFIKYLTTWGYLLAILFLYFICILWTWRLVFWILRYFVLFVAISFSRKQHIFHAVVDFWTWCWIV